MEIQRFGLLVKINLTQHIVTGSIHRDSLFGVGGVDIAQVNLLNSAIAELNIDGFCRVRLALIVERQHATLVRQTQLHKIRVVMHPHLFYVRRVRQVNSAKHRVKLLQIVFARTVELRQLRTVLHRHTRQRKAVVERESSEIHTAVGYDFLHRRCHQIIVIFVGIHRDAVGD